MLSECTGDVLSLQYDPDDKYIAAGKLNCLMTLACGDGHIKVFNSFTGKMTFNMQAAQHQEVMPFTCIRWRPSGDSKSSNVLVSTSSDGLIQHWAVNLNKCTHTINEANGNDLYAVDFSHDGRQFAAGG